MLTPRRFLRGPNSRGVPGDFPVGELFRFSLGSLFLALCFQCSSGPPDKGLPLPPAAANQSTGYYEGPAFLSGKDASASRTLPGSIPYGDDPAFPAGRGAPPGAAISGFETQTPFQWIGFLRQSAYTTRASPGPFSYSGPRIVSVFESKVQAGGEYRGDRWQSLVQLNLSATHVRGESEVAERIYAGEKSQRNRAMQLERRELRRDTLLRAKMHRMYLGYNTQKVDFRLGRQAIGWGQGRFLNPLDLLTPTGPFVRDLEDVPGADAANFSYYFNGFNQLQLVAVPHHRNNRKNFRDLKMADTDALARYKGTAGALDFALLGGQHFRSRVAGAEFVLTKWDASFRAAYLGRRENEAFNFISRIPGGVPAITVHQGVLGASYAFLKGDLRTNLEFFYNSYPLRSERFVTALLAYEEQVRAEAVKPLPGDRSFFRTQGRILTRNPYLAQISVGYDFGLTVTGEGVLIIDPDGKSVFFGPRLSWNLSDEAVLNAGLSLFKTQDDRASAEFAGRENELFALARWHF